MTAPAAEAKVETPTVEPRIRWRLVPISVVVALAVNLWSQIGLFLTNPGWSLFSFRWYYPHDQLSYLAIVTNSAQGDFRAVEPFTLTGANHYPRAYYQALGAVADVLGIAPVTAWNFAAVAFQSTLVLVLALVCVVVSRRWWAAALAPLPLMIGTFSVLLTGDWKSELGSHAVLWGPFGTLFTANGEAAALCIAGIALLAILLVALGRVPQRLALLVAILACAMIGVLSAVQTYSFLTATFLLVYAAGTYGLILARRWQLVAVSLAIVVLVFLVGPPVADSISPLAALVVGATPALPGLVVLCRRLRWLPLWCGVALVATALPQTLATALGVASGDAFLVYREASSKDLGIPLAGGLRAALIPLLALVLLAVVAARRRSPVHGAVGAGGVAAWLMVATNDVWGANQEPYRFWLDSFILLSIVALPLLVDLAAGMRAVRPHGGAVAGEDVSRRERTSYRIAVGVVAVLSVISLADLAEFRREVSTWAPLDFSNERTVALAEAASATSTDGILLPDPCLDQFTVKTAWGGATAFYNLGLAWPAERDALQDTLDARTEGWFDAESARTAGVDWMLTESTCSAGWPLEEDAADLEQVTTVEYPGGSFTLWRVLAD